MRFSIIVPVYNIEKYIKECIDSVLDQDFEKYELILVDDGSTDGSGIICDRYADTDKRIRVIHNQNEGPSSARNKGIRNAKGEFIIFLDSDDYWCRNTMLSELDAYISETGVDITAFDGYSSWIEDRGVAHIDSKDMNKLISRENGYCPEDFIRTHLQKNTYYTWYPWQYVFSRHLFIDNGLYFPQGKKYEDTYLIWRILLKAEKIGVFPQKYYIYRRNRPGATTAKPTYQSLNDFLWVIEDNIETLNGADISSDVKELLADCFSKFYFSCCIMATLLKGNERRRYKQELKAKKIIMTYAISNKQIFITKIEKLIGFNGMLWVYTLWRKLKKKAGK